MKFSVLYYEVIYVKKNVTWKLLCNILLLFVYVIQIKTILMEVYPVLLFWMVSKCLHLSLDSITNYSLIYINYRVIILLVNQHKQYLK